MILASGERVPSLRKYKLLGTLVDYSVSEAETVDKAVKRSVTAVRLMSRLGGAERRRASRLWLVIPRGVAGFYGRSQGWSLAQAEAVGVAQRKALSRQGHRHWRGARLQVYAPEAAGGLGEPHMYAIAAAAMVDEFDRALSGGRYDPARVSAESAIAATAVRLGFVPSAAQPTPLDWYPEHLEQHLREDVNVEMWKLVQLRAGVRTRSTAGVWRSLTPGDSEAWQNPRDGGGRVVWERPGVRFSPELCALGLWRYVDAFGGTDAAGVGRWLELGGTLQATRRCGRRVRAVADGDGATGIRGGGRRPELGPHRGRLATRVFSRVGPGVGATTGARRCPAPHRPTVGG